ncbi:MAG: ATP-binding protein [Actinomycetota bacterium]|nr:ATP-binding protein [Actinomycetota bacterium]
MSDLHPCVGMPQGEASAGTTRREAAAVFEPIPRAVRSARRFVGALIPDARQRETAELLVSELASNAVRYASGPFEVRVQLRPQIRIEVRDASERMPSVMAPRADAERGRGLRIVNELASAWGVEPELGGKVVWFSL